MEDNNLNKVNNIETSQNQNISNQLPNNNEDEKNKERKKSNTFNIIIGISTLLIAILGATFAYFTATARSQENDVSVQAAYVSISYEGGTEIKATNLIPASETVALSKYQKAVEEAPEGTEEFEEYDNVKGNDPDRRCVDANGREVCYVYQFSIDSEGEVGTETTIAGAIQINRNDFTDLSYVVYEVSYRTDSEGNEVLDKFGNKIVSSYGIGPISSFTEEDENHDNKASNPKFAYFERPFDKTGETERTVFPKACLFGYVEDSTAEEDDISRCTTLNISNGEKHYYQVLIWLEEKGISQDEQQGKLFEGTVNIEVLGNQTDGDSSNGKITGKD